MKRYPPVFWGVGDRDVPKGKIMLASQLTREFGPLESKLAIWGSHPWGSSIMEMAEVGMEEVEVMEMGDMVEKKGVEVKREFTELSRGCACRGYGPGLTGSWVLAGGGS